MTGAWARPGAGVPHRLPAGAWLLLRHVGRYRWRYLGGLGLLAATTGCALTIPLVVRWTIEAIRTGMPARAVILGPLGIVLLALAQGVTRAASRFALLGASQRVEAELRDALFGRLVHLPPAFYQAQRTGDLMSRVTNDLHAVATLIGFGLLSLVSTGLILLGTLVAMLRLDPWLTAAALAPCPVMVLVATRFNTRAHLASLAVQEQLSRLSDRVQENLAGMAAVRAYTREAVEVEAFRRENQEHLRRTLTQARTEGVFSPLMGTIAGLGTLTVLWLGGQAVVDGRITLGDFVAFASYLAYLTWPILALGWVLAMTRRGLTALGRVAEILEATSPAAIPEEAPRLTVAEPAGEVEFRRLTFAYAPDRAPALREVSLRIGGGETVAVVGPTGAGKTTLTSLLVRLWEPPPGSVFVGGREVGSIPLPRLRGMIGHVAQESLLFSLPLHDNVTFGAHAAGLEAAARTAALSEDVATFPHGWDTVVGERGLTLSGGQRQRVALARALIRQPSLLILDDAFASVDADTEARILEELRRSRRGRTTVVVTHRLRAAELADRVIVLEAGTVVEEGSHRDLLARGGLYARLWQRQALQARLESA